MLDAGPNDTRPRDHRRKTLGTLDRSAPSASIVTGSASAGAEDLTWGPPMGARPPGGRLPSEALARHHLSSSSLPAAEISFLLGYDDPNSFCWAFYGWTGMTPEGVRTAAVQESPGTQLEQAPLH